MIKLGLKEQIPWKFPISLVVLQLSAIAVARIYSPLAPLSGLDSIERNLFHWDGEWYFNIATFGYQWHPQTQTTQQFNMAFFPGQALIDWLLISLHFLNEKALILFSSLIEGIISIIYFKKLATKVLSIEEVYPAIFCFVFWPASTFYFMGYPTGLISLFIILALIAHLDQKFWTAAFWLGLGSAFAPTVVFVGFALGLIHLIDLFGQKNRLLEFVKLVFWGAAALSGLAAFVIYQAIALHDPFAFIKAQEAWGTAPSLFTRLVRFLTPHWYIEQLIAGYSEIQRGDSLMCNGQTSEGFFICILGVQRFINFLSFCMILTGLMTISFRLRGRASAIPISGWIVFFGYIFTIFTSSQNMICVPRLLSPAVGIFLGFGMITSRVNNLFRISIFGALLFLSFLEIYFAAAGFWVV